MTRLKCFHGWLFSLWLIACVTSGQVRVKTPGNKSLNYPPFIEATAARQQAVATAWQALAREYQLPETARYDSDPILLSLRALPLELAGRIVLLSSTMAASELEIKAVVRRFIEKYAVLLGVTPDSAATGQLVLSAEGSLLRVVYRQSGFAHPLAEGYGEMQLVLSKTGALLQWNCRLIPNVTLPAQAALRPSVLPRRFINREFTYSNIAGQPQRYKVTRAEEVSVKELVVYPRISNDRLTIHLAYSVMVGAGMTWTVYLDAMTGEELGVKANFVS